MFSCIFDEQLTATVHDVDSQLACVNPILLATLYARNSPINDADTLKRNRRSVVPVAGTRCYLLHFSLYFSSVFSRSGARSSGDRLNPTVKPSHTAPASKDIKFPGMAHENGSLRLISTSWRQDAINFESGFTPPPSPPP